MDKLYFRPAIRQRFVVPGAVQLFDINLHVDEAEVSNLEWQHFLSYVAQDSGQAAVARYQPRPKSLPLPDYFRGPFYRLYPVVGISREQAEAYCRWRSAVTTQELADRRGLLPTDSAYMVMHYRLPTEAEWEFAAGRYTLPAEPYGVPQPTVKVLVNPQAASYISRRAGATQSSAQVRQDILAFNKTGAPLVQFNCQREAPYFLALPTPGYVFDLPGNIFGLYHMAGNVAELVQEPNLTKGGSYRTSLAECAIASRGRYAGPANDVGFRCVCEVSFPYYQR